MEGEKTFHLPSKVAINFGQAPNIMQTNTRTEHGHQIHEITVEPGDFFVIKLRNDRLVTIDSGNSEVYFHLREAVEEQHTIDVGAALHLEGVLVLTVACDAGSARINGVEIVL